MSSTSLLLSIQTHSIEDALRPIAQKVDGLQRAAMEFQSTQSPVSIISPAQSVFEAVKKLERAATDQLGKVVLEQPDYKQSLDIACKQSFEGAKSLLEVADEMRDGSSLASPEASCQKLQDSACEILNGTVKLLLLWDKSQVEKIVRIAQWTTDRLKAVQTAQSMRALVVFYNGFFEAMMKLIDVSTQRYQDLISISRKKKIFSCLKTIRKRLPQLSHSMQCFIKNRESHNEKEKNHHARAIEEAIKGIVVAVNGTQEEEEEEEEEQEEEEEEKEEEEEEEEEEQEEDEEEKEEDVNVEEKNNKEDDDDIYNLSDSSDNILDSDPEDEAEETIATQVQQLQRRLSLKERREIISSELDKNLETIVNNSMTVAHKSRPRFRELIEKLCNEVKEISKELSKQYTALKDNPSSSEAETQFDDTADKLCEKLEELDKLVANSVADQVADVYVAPSVPIDDLVKGAVTSSSPVEEMSSESTEGLGKKVEVFRQHSKRLSEVAINAAQGTLSRRRSKRIKRLTSQLDDLTKKVTSAATRIRNNPHDTGAGQHLNELRKEWQTKVKELTAAIDEIINVTDFTAATEATIVGDMEKCRTAMEKRKWHEVVVIVHEIAAKAKRFSDVSKNRTGSIPNQQLKKSIRGAIMNLELAVKEMVDCTKTIATGNVTEQDTHNLIKALQHVLESIHTIQELLPDTLEPPLSHENSTTSVSSGIIPQYQFRPSPSVTTGGEGLTTLSLSPSSLQSSGGVTNHFPAQPLSPSDEWITSPSSTEPPSSLFGPTDPSIHDDEIASKWTTSTPHVLLAQQPITYPHSLGGTGDGYTLSHLASSFGWQRSPTPSIDSQENTELCHIYTKPLEDVVQAATEGNQKQLQEKATEFAMKAQELSKLAETAAKNSRNQEVARVLNKESANITYLTPRIIKKAEEVLNMEEEEEEEGESSLHELGQEWTGHLYKLLEASQVANMPWSRSARRLVTSAKNKRGLNKEISHIGSQTQRMVGVASTTIKAALVEDSIGSTTNLEHAQDPNVQKQIESVQEQVEDIELVTPQFIRTAGQDQPEDEKLYLLSHQWATAANALMKNVDDITFGMSGPADALLIAAKSNDSELLKEQAESIKRIADSMLTVAKDAVEGCDDESLVKSVLDTAQEIQELSSELVQYAHEIASLRNIDEEGHQLAVEKAEVLRRDWAAKMHLLTAYIDDLTANVAGPLDRLVSVALQASRTDGMAKEHLLEQFKAKKEFATGQLEKVNSELDCVMKKMKSSQSLVMKCKKNMGFLVKVLPSAIAAAKSLSDDPSSIKLDEFSHLRRQWTAKAQSFHYELVFIDENESDIDVSLAVSLFRDLLQGYETTRTTPSAQKTSRSRGKGDGSNKKERHYLTDDLLEAPNYPPPPPPIALDDSHINYDSTGNSPKLSHPWKQSVEHTSSLPLDVSLNRSLIGAARQLQDVVDEFEEEGNPLVGLAKKMTSRMFQMVEYTKGKGQKIQTMQQMIDTCKAIADDANQIAEFAIQISEQCADKRIKNDLQYCTGKIPNISKQLKLVASVKLQSLAQTDVSRADKMLEKNAQNLMETVQDTIKAAEAACIKGLKPPENEEEVKTTQLAIEWKKKLYHRRAQEYAKSHLSPRGLRRLSRGNFKNVPGY